MGLHGDLSNHYFGVKNSNKKSSEFLSSSPCLNLWCGLSTFGHLRAIPASFSSAVFFSRNITIIYMGI